MRKWSFLILLSLVFAVNYDTVILVDQGDVYLKASLWKISPNYTQTSSIQDLDKYYRMGLLTKYYEDVVELHKQLDVYYFDKGKKIMLCSGQSPVFCEVPKSLFKNNSISVFVEFSGEKEYNPAIRTLYFNSYSSSPFSIFSSVLRSFVDLKNPMCLMAFVLFGVLVATMYMSGNDPLALFDISVIKTRKLKPYTFSWSDNLSMDALKDRSERLLKVGKETAASLMSTLDSEIMKSISDKECKRKIQEIKPIWEKLSSGKALSGEDRKRLEENFDYLIKNDPKNSEFYNELYSHLLSLDTFTIGAEKLSAAEFHASRNLFIKTVKMVPGLHPIGSVMESVLVGTKKFVNDIKNVAKTIKRAKTGELKEKGHWKVHNIEPEVERFWKDFKNELKDELIRNYIFYRAIEILDEEKRKRLISSLISRHSNNLLLYKGKEVSDILSKLDNKELNQLLEEMRQEYKKKGINGALKIILKHPVEAPWYKQLLETYNNLEKIEHSGKDTLSKINEMYSFLKSQEFYKKENIRELIENGELFVSIGKEFFVNEAVNYAFYRAFFSNLSNLYMKDISLRDLYEETYLKFLSLYKGNNDSKFWEQIVDGKKVDLYSYVLFGKDREFARVFVKENLKQLEKKYKDKIYETSVKLLLLDDPKKLTDFVLNLKEDSIEEAISYGVRLTESLPSYPDLSEETKFQIERLFKFLKKKFGENIKSDSAREFYENEFQSLLKYISSKQLFDMLEDTDKDVVIDKFLSSLDNSDQKKMAELFNKLITLTEGKFFYDLLTDVGKNKLASKYMLEIFDNKKKTLKKEYSFLIKDLLKYKLYKNFSNIVNLKDKTIHTYIRNLLDALGVPKQESLSKALSDKKIKERVVEEIVDDFLKKQGLYKKLKTKLSISSGDITKEFILEHLEDLIPVRDSNGNLKVYDLLYDEDAMKSMEDKSKSWGFKGVLYAPETYNPEYFKTNMHFMWHMNKPHFPSTKEQTALGYALRATYMSPNPPISFEDDLNRAVSQRINNLLMGSAKSVFKADKERHRPNMHLSFEPHLNYLNKVAESHMKVLGAKTYDELTSKVESLNKSGGIKWKNVYDTGMFVTKEGDAILVHEDVNVPVSDRGFPSVLLVAKEPNGIYRILDGKHLSRYSDKVMKKLSKLLPSVKDYKHLKAQINDVKQIIKLLPKKDKDVLSKLIKNIEDAIKEDEKAQTDENRFKSMKQIKDFNKYLESLYSCSYITDSFQKKLEDFSKSLDDYIVEYANYKDGIKKGDKILHNINSIESTVKEIKSLFNEIETTIINSRIKKDEKENLLNYFNKFKQDLDLNSLNKFRLYLDSIYEKTRYKKQVNSIRLKLEEVEKKLPKLKEDLSTFNSNMEKYFSLFKKDEVLKKYQSLIELKTLLEDALNNLEDDNYNELSKSISNILAYDIPKELSKVIEELKKLKINKQNKSKIKKLILSCDKELDKLIDEKYIDYYMFSLASSFEFTDILASEDKLQEIKRLMNKSKTQKEESKQVLEKLKNGLFMVSGSAEIISDFFRQNYSLYRESDVKNFLEQIKNAPIFKDKNYEQLLSLMKYFKDKDPSFYESLENFKKIVGILKKKLKNKDYSTQDMREISELLRTSDSPYSKIDENLDLLGSYARIMKDESVKKRLLDFVHSSIAMPIRRLNETEKNTLVRLLNEDGSIGTFEKYSVLDKLGKSLGYDILSEFKLVKPVSPKRAVELVFLKNLPKNIDEKYVKDILEILKKASKLNVNSKASVKWFLDNIKDLGIFSDINKVKSLLSSDKIDEVTKTWLNMVVDLKEKIDNKDYSSSNLELFDKLIRDQPYFMDKFYSTLSNYPFWFVGGPDKLKELRKEIKEGKIPSKLPEEVRTPLIKTLEILDSLTEEDRIRLQEMVSASELMRQRAHAISIQVLHSKYLPEHLKNKLLKAASSYQAAWSFTITRDPRAGSTQEGRAPMFDTLYHRGPMMLSDPEAFLGLFGPTHRYYLPPRNSFIMKLYKFGFSKIAKPFGLWFRSFSQHLFWHPSIYTYKYDVHGRVHALSSFPSTPSLVPELYTHLIPGVFSNILSKNAYMRKYQLGGEPMVNGLPQFPEQYRRWVNYGYSVHFLDTANPNLSHVNWFGESRMDPRVAMYLVDAYGYDPYLSGQLGYTMERNEIPITAKMYNLVDRFGGVKLQWDRTPTWAPVGYSSFYRWFIKPFYEPLNLPPDFFFSKLRTSLPSREDLGSTFNRDTFWQWWNRVSAGGSRHFAIEKYVRPFVSGATSPTLLLTFGSLFSLGSIPFSTTLLGMGLSFGYLPFSRSLREKLSKSIDFYNMWRTMGLRNYMYLSRRRALLAEKNPSILTRLLGYDMALKKSAKEVWKDIKRELPEEFAGRLRDVYICPRCGYPYVVRGFKCPQCGAVIR